MVGAMNAGFDTNLMDTTVQLTLFAPVNEAFSVFDPSFAMNLFTDPHYALHLNEIIGYHITDVELTAEELLGINMLPMLAGGALRFDSSSGSLMILSSADPGSILQADIDATNGIMHTVDTVLLPPFAALNMFSFMEIYDRQVQETFSTFRTLIVTAGMEMMIRFGTEQTLLAPNNEGFSPELIAFLNDPENVSQLDQFILYHLIDQVLNFNLIPNLGSMAYTTVQGEDVMASRFGGLRFEGAASRLFGLVAQGFVYEIERPIIPPSLRPTIPTQSARFKTFSAMIQGNRDPTKVIVEPEYVIDHAGPDMFQHFGGW